MDKIKIGIPRALHYYHYKEIWKNTLEALGFEVIISPPTNRAILNQGLNIANDEMCLSLKVYLGHVKELEGKCDYILIPRIDNYGISNQTCTNFLAIYDIVNNLINTPILDYNVDLEKKETHLKGMIQIGKKFHIPKKKVKEAFKKSLEKKREIEKRNHIECLKKCSQTKRKVLLVGHRYNIHDSLIGKSILDILNQQNVVVIEADKLDPKITEAKAHKISKKLYWKYNKQLLGGIEHMKEKVDGIIFLSSFPCGPDSLANELALRRIEKPTLNIIIDDIDGLAGIETRIESFIDILEERNQWQKNQ